MDKYAYVGIKVDLYLSVLQTNAPIVWTVRVVQ